MKLRFAVALAVIVAGLGKPVVVHAAPANSDAPVVLAKGKIVKFALRNDSGVSVELKVGDQVMTLDVGKTVSLKLPVGTRIIVNTPTSNHQPGELLAEASTYFSNSTLAIK